MNHKKSMRIFWLSLCLLLLSGVIIITVVQIKSREDDKERQNIEETQRQDGQAEANIQTNTLAEEDANQYADRSKMDGNQNTVSEDTAADIQPTIGEPVTYLYELRVKNGYLEVYYYHTEQLFFHTGIPYRVLTVHQRQQLDRGKYFKNEQELYGYLESCTS